MPPTIDTEQTPLADFNESKDLLMESSLFLTKQSLVRIK